MITQGEKMGYYTQDEIDDTMRLLHNFCIEPKNLHNIITHYHLLKAEVSVEDGLQQQNAELTHEILELREQVRRLETKEFLTYATDDETAYDMDEIIHMSEVIKYLERKLEDKHDVISVNSEFDNSSLYYKLKEQE